MNWTDFMIAIKQGLIPSKKELERHSVTKHRGTSEEVINSIYDSLHSNANDGEWYEATVAHEVAYPEMGGGQYYVCGVRTLEGYGWQYAICYDAKTRMFCRSLMKGVWGAWQSLTNYLPLTGGTIAKEGYEPLTINNQIATASGVYVKYQINGTNCGNLGFGGLNKPTFYPTGGGTAKEILHTGNSAKVHIGTTAPNDTTGNVLFINTSA